VIFVPFLQRARRVEARDLIVSQPNDTAAAALGELSIGGGEKKTAKFFRPGAAARVIERRACGTRKLHPEFWVFPVFLPAYPALASRTHRRTGGVLLAYNVPGDDRWRTQRPVLWFLR